MVSRQIVCESNENASSLTGLVSVFVGGTHGVGESTVRELFRSTTSPRAYILGRNAEKGKSIAHDLMESRPGSTAIYLHVDISLLKSVDAACEEIQKREQKINVILLTAGHIDLRGRNDTPEGIDYKMCVNYYGRMRVIHNLLPQLKAAGDNGELSRVLSILAAGAEGDIRIDDLDLKHSYTLHACLAHCVLMTDFMVEELAKRYPTTAFSHSYPGDIKTGFVDKTTGPLRLAIKVLYAVSARWILNFRESAERHVFQITSLLYPPRNGGSGIPKPEGMETAAGTDGVPGSGGYLLDWDGKVTGNEEVMRRYREQNAGPQIWEHTLDIFKKATSNKRPADETAEGGMRPSPSPPNPVGWRPAS